MYLDVILLQSGMVTPTMGDLKAANALFARSTKHAKGNGLFFYKFQFPLRINVVQHASVANKSQPTLMRDY